MTSRARTDLFWATGFLLGSTATLLLVDPLVGPVGQWVLGLALSPGPVAWLWLREDASVRAQTLVALLGTCTVELMATHGLGWWEYRLGNFPGFVPGGHVTVFLSSLVIARSLAPRLPHRLMIGATFTVAGLWAAWGLFLSPRLDVFGAFWFVVMVAASRHAVIGPRIPYVFIVTSFLELTGVHFGVWAYQPHDVTGLLAIGNPPSGISGAYAFIDYLALLLAPLILHAWNHRPSLHRRVTWPRQRSAASAPEHVPTMVQDSTAPHAHTATPEAPADANHPCR
ncbi:hypothetical protein AB5J49_43120 [Streptomyces sp. R28]|uniref:Lycopene cyclase domain-containing protein n=1 Tax=Streptomyces sp. R28 TaxID=3238628 RepID=A0AB39Q8M4_9ACTN